MAHVHGVSGDIWNGRIRSKKADWRSQNLKISKKANNDIFSTFYHLYHLLLQFFDIFEFWLLRPAFFDLICPFHMSPLTPRTWATFIGPNQCYESKFGEINLPYSNFQVLPSSGLLAAFLVLEFKVNTFSILLGPNDPKKVKKLQKSYTIVSLAFDLAFTTFLAFFGLFISFWHLLM